MKLLAVFLLVSSVVIQASAHYCRYDWTPIGNRCFLYVPYPMTWVAAERNCQSTGGNLASIRNSYEYRQVQNLIAAAGHGSEETWIGGSNAQEWKSWLWSDGSPMMYKNWCSWQPDNFLLTQHCLQMNYSDKNCWDDMWCSSIRPSVCAKKPCLE